MGFIWFSVGGALLSLRPWAWMFAVIVVGLSLIEAFFGNLYGRQFGDLFVARHDPPDHPVLSQFGQGQDGLRPRGVGFGLRFESPHATGDLMTDRSLDELGPVDYLIVEFPAGTQNFTGEGAGELIRLHDAGIIRIMDILILQKGEDGTVMAQELGDLDELGELGRIEAQPHRPSPKRTSTTSPRPWIPAASPESSCTRTCGRRRSPRRCAGQVAS